MCTTASATTHTVTLTPPALTWSPRIATHVCYNVQRLLLSKRGTWFTPHSERLPQLCKRWYVPETKTPTSTFRGNRPHRMCRNECLEVSSRNSQLKPICRPNYWKVFNTYKRNSNMPNYDHQCCVYIPSRLDYPIRNNNVHTNRKWHAAHQPVFLHCCAIISAKRDARKARFTNKPVGRVNYKMNQLLHASVNILPIINATRTYFVSN